MPGLEGNAGARAGAQGAQTGPSSDQGKERKKLGRLEPCSTEKQRLKRDLTKAQPYPLNPSVQELASIL